MIKKIGLLTLLFMMTSACGYQPLYGENTNKPSVLAEFSTIEVRKIPGKLGQQLAISLQDKLAPYGLADTPKYSLIVNLTSAVTGFGFRQDESITRQNLKMMASYQLVNLDDKQTVLSGNANANMTYDVVQSDFSNLSAQEDAERRTGEQIINTIVTRLGFFLKTSQDK
jgi:LPS-assembly lipoprotein